LPGFGFPDEQPEENGVQKSDKLTSASFQPLAVVPSGSRKTPLKRSRSSPAAQPLRSLGGTASRSRPCFPPEFEPGLRLEECLHFPTAPQ
jgi:hypothetical protein